MTAVQAAPKPEVLREPDYLAWLRWQQCRVCRKLGRRQETSSDAAHTPRVRIHGDVAISLCRCHHDEEERLQPEAFARKYDLDLLAEYEEQHAQYLADRRIYAF